MLFVAIQGEARVMSFHGCLVAEYWPSIDDSTEIEARISIAAEQGDPEALIAIGHLYERGACISAAAEWYDRAAKRGNSDALVKLAWFYFDGKGVLRDRASCLRVISLRSYIKEIFGSVATRMDVRKRNRRRLQSANRHES